MQQNMNVTSKQRKELRVKMAEVFKGNLEMLSTELQKILLDDMVTAFQNRMKVLIRAHGKNRC